MEDSVGAKFYCPHALADSNQMKMKQKPLMHSEKGVVWYKQQMIHQMFAHYPMQSRKLN